MRIEVSERIDRPVADVFRFYADEHVRNHPRWDPAIELWTDSDEPMRVGRVIQRRNSRSGTPVTGTMEVTEYEPNRSFGMLIREGPMEIPGRATFEETDGGTRLTMTVDMPIDPSMKEQVEGMIRGSAGRIRQLVENETSQRVSG